MWAILSDVHANLEALQAVLSDIDRHRASRIICLGDILGYGPDPVACLDRVRERCEVVLLGDHDQAQLSDPEWSAALPAEGFLWERRQMNQQGTREECKGRWVWLESRPVSHNQGPWLFVHGSPCDAVVEYIVPEDIYNPSKLTRNFDCFAHACFCGHTHMPGVFVDATGYDVKTNTALPAQGERRWDYDAPVAGHIDGYELTHHKMIVNVGSVGQPRDGDWRACYVLFDGNRVTYRRVEYDVDRTVQKIYATPEIHNMQGDRLRDGR